MRRTKIVATIGPSSHDQATLERLVEAGVDVLRLNFSHGEHAQHLEVMQSAREIAAKRGRPIALLQDLSGPKIRTGKVKGGTPVELRDGARLRITTDETVEGTADLISTTYDPLPQDVAAGDTILLDDGNLELKVLGAAEQTRRLRGRARRPSEVEQGHEPPRGQALDTRPHGEGPTRPRLRRRPGGRLRSLCPSCARRRTSRRRRP